jgi:peptide/nickel transport system permease protein
MTTTTGPTAPAAPAPRESRRWAPSRFFHWVRHTDPFVVLAGAFILLLVFAAIFAPLITTRDPQEQELIDSFLPPWSPATGGGRYLLGTDDLGRDIYSRLVYGLRPLAVIVIVSVTLAATVGFFYGVVAGAARNGVSNGMMRVADIQLAIPPVILSIVLAVALTPGMRSVILAIALVTWPQFARVVRSEVLRVRTSEYVQLARVAGLRGRALLRHHVMPNVMNSFVVMCALSLSVAIIFATALSFLGIGVQPPEPSWGGMIADGTSYMQDSWWMVVVPGVAITLTVLALNVIGDHVRDVLDPRIARATIVRGGT